MVNQVITLSNVMVSSLKLVSGMVVQFLWMSMACGLEPRFRQEAGHDENLSSLRGHPEFDELVRPADDEDVG